MKSWYFLLPDISRLWSAGYSPEHVNAPRCDSYRQWAGLFFLKDVDDLYLQLSWRRRGWGKQWACSVSVRSCPRTHVFPCKPGRSSACTSGWWCEQFGFWYLFCKYEFSSWPFWLPSSLLYRNTKPPLCKCWCQFVIRESFCCFTGSGSDVYCKSCRLIWCTCCLLFFFSLFTCVLG